MASLGETAVSAWSGASSTHLRTRQAQKLEREEGEEHFNNLWTQLRTQKIAFIGDDDLAHIDVDKANEILPVGGMANLVDAALRGTNLSKYEGLDGKLKQGKIVGIHKQEGGDYDGMYTLMIENEKGVLSFLSRNRKEVDPSKPETADDIVYMDSEDISKMLDVAARRILAGTTYADQIAAGMEMEDFKDREEAKYEKSVEEKAQAKRNKDLAAEEEFIFNLGQEDLSPQAASAQTQALGAVAEHMYIAPENVGKSLIGDNQKIQQTKKPAGPYGTSFASTGAGTPAAGKPKAAATQWDDKNNLWKKMPVFRQANMQQAMDEIERELARPEEKTPFAQDVTGEAGSPSGKQAKKVFDHLKLPTKSGKVTRAHWEEARDYMEGLKGTPETGPVEKAKENLKNIDADAKIEAEEQPDTDTVDDLKSALEFAGVGSIDEYRDWARKELGPHERAAANWVIAAIGSDTKQEQINTYQELQDKTARTLAVQEAQVGQKERELGLKKTELMRKLGKDYQDLDLKQAQKMDDDFSEIDDFYENYLFDRGTGLVRHKTTEDLTLTMDNIIDKGAQVVRKVTQGISAGRYTTEKSFKLANKKLNATYATMMEAYAAKASEGTRWGLFFTPQAREAWRDYGGPIFGLGKRQRTAASMGDVWKRIRIDRARGEIVFVTDPYGTPEKTRNSVSMLQIAEGFFDENAMTQFEALLKMNNVKDLNPKK